MSLHSTSLRRTSSTPRLAHAVSHLRYPPRWVLSVVKSVVLGLPRSFSADARWLVEGTMPAPRVENAHWIPAGGPFVLVTNHYYKPGYSAWWGIALIAVAIAQVRTSGEEVMWVMTNRWTYPDWLRAHLVTPLTYWLFSRLAHVYGLVSMPPMPPQPQYRDEAVRAVRRMLSLPATGGPELMIGIAPEGRDSADGSLIEPPQGVGRLLLHLAEHGLRLLPVGVAEVNGALTARFGPPFELQIANGRGHDRKELDHLASAQVMTAIGAQLPCELWGAYRARIEALVSHQNA